MFEYYYAALFSRALKSDLAWSALPDAPVRPDRRDRDRGSPAGPVAAGPDESSRWDPCPCGRWGVCRADLHGCAALCRELFADLDRELDAWDAAHGWLYR
jgi:hypothetical protein